MAIRVRASERSRSWLSVASLFVVFGVVDATWASRIPLIRERLALSELGLSIALAGPAVGLVVAALVVARPVRRWGSAPVARVAATSAACGLVLPALAWSEATLLVSLALWGVCLGALDITMNDQASELERRAGRARMSGLHATYSTAVLVFAPIGSLAAAVGLAPRTHFAAVAVLAATGAAWATRCLLPTARAGVLVPDQDDDVDDAAAIPPLSVIGLLGFVGFLAEGAMVNWSGVLLHGPDHASLVVAPLALTGFSVGMIAGRASGDRLVERYGYVAVASAAAVLAACGMGIAAGVPIAVPAIGGCALAGAGLSVLAPIAFALAGRTPGPSRVQAITRLTIVAYAALFVGPPAVGLIAAVMGLRAALLTVAATTLGIVPVLRARVG